MLTKEQQDAIRSRCEVATLGPWELLRVKTDGANGDWFLLDEETRLAIIEKSDANAVFIAHARQDIPALLDALEAMTRRAEALERTIKSSDFMPELDFACQTCAHLECPDGECCAADNRHRSWKFDEARFAGKDGV